MTAPTRQNQTSNRMRGCLASAVSLVGHVAVKMTRSTSSPAAMAKTGLGDARCELPSRGKAVASRNSFCFGEMVFTV